MHKNILAVGVVVMVLIVALLVIKRPNMSQPKLANSNVQIAASFYPLYFFASEIAGEQATVVNLTPFGAEPHDYEPSTDDLRFISESDLLILNGVHFEPWADKVTEILKDRNTRVLEVAEDLATKEMVHDGEAEIDPHTWLDPVLAQEEVKIITTALIEIDPEHTADYEARSKDLIARLEALNQEFAQRLQTCAKRNVVTSHAAFGYLTDRYQLTQMAISGLSPDDEPSPKDLADAAEFARSNNVDYIFFETLISPKLAETVAREIGAQTQVLDPLEGLTQEEQNRGSDYFSVQRENLENLTVALTCQ
ncbi:ABC transporter substrate-binding protein [Candidatus Microgenomates bacterium]|nr:MAG: ABC transporter substrate-binding protein [Candidatus Microgenomates bacterium]